MPLPPPAHRLREAPLSIRFPDAPILWFAERVRSGAITADSAGWPDWVAIEAVQSDFQRYMAVQGLRRTRSALELTLQIHRYVHLRRAARQVDRAITGIHGIVHTIPATVWGWELPDLATCRASLIDAGFAKLLVDVGESVSEILSDGSHHAGHTEIEPLRHPVLNDVADGHHFPLDSAPLGAGNASENGGDSKLPIGRPKAHEDQFKPLDLSRRLLVQILVHLHHLLLHADLWLFRRILAFRPADAAPVQHFNVRMALCLMGLDAGFWAGAKVAESRLEGEP